MVIGNGLMGVTFSEFNDDNNILIFASGVSNSRETNENEFQREVNLLNYHINTKAKLVYFSSCSIFDECLKESEYIAHKKNVERLIMEQSNCYLIIRLPNVVSNHSNPHTSFNFYKNRLLNNQTIDVDILSYRYYIDIEDVLVTCSQLIKNGDLTNKTINVCFTSKINTLDLVNMITKRLNVNSAITKINQGCDYTVNNNEFLAIIDKKYATYGYDYNNELVKKYVV